MGTALSVSPSSDMAETLSRGVLGGVAIAEGDELDAFGGDTLTRDGELDHSVAGKCITIGLF